MSECVEIMCEIDCYGTKRWYKDGLLHREDGPAVEDPDGYKAWYFYGSKNREDGPAIEFKNGDVEYWVDGVQVTGVEVFVKFGVING